MIKFLRRKNRVNTKIKSIAPDFRVIIDKSNTCIRAQVLDATGRVLAHACDKDLKAKTKTERAELAGTQLAELMKKQSIVSATFDRNWYLYHGRIKAFVEGLRKGGIAI